MGHLHYLQVDFSRRARTEDLHTRDARKRQTQNGDLVKSRKSIEFLMSSYEMNEQNGPKIDFMGFGFSGPTFAIGEPS
jgi:hypothetical protein